MCYSECFRLIENPDTTDSEAGEFQPQVMGTPGFRFGLQRIAFEAIDELSLTLWGNLLVKSKAVSGKSFEEHGDRSSQNIIQVVARLPIAAVDQRELKEFATTVIKYRPEVVLNKRFEKRIDSKMVKGEELVRLLGAAFLCFVLLDLGFSTGFYLEMLKHYHLCQLQARAIENKSTKNKNADNESYLLKARSEFERADNMRLQPMWFSLVHKALFEHNSAAGGVWQARAEGQWYMGFRKDAIESIGKAHQYYPQSLKLAIEYARWLAIEGRLAESERVLSFAIEEHEDEFLPRLYMLVLSAQKEDIPGLMNLYRKYCQDLDTDLFGRQPWWPPGGDRFLSQRWYREDLHFLLDRLLP